MEVIECWQLLLKYFFPGKKIANHHKLPPEGNFATGAKKPTNVNIKDTKHDHTFL